MPWQTQLVQDHCREVGGRRAQAVDRQFVGGACATRHTA